MPGPLNLPPRPLPRTVTPFTDETIASYLTRLAHANQLKPDTLRVDLTGQPFPPRYGPVPVDALAAVSGQPARTLRYAILELCTDTDLAGMHTAGRPQPQRTPHRGTPPSDHQPRPACRLCARARGITTTVWCWHQPEDLVCHQHRRWTGVGIDTHAQPDLSAIPEILRANRQHRRLIRHYSRATVNFAFTIATRICQTWHRRRDNERHDQGFQRLLHTLGGRADPPARDLHRPIIQAAAYPQAIALTRLLASPHWRALALRDPHGEHQFHNEIRRTVAPGYTPRPTGYHHDSLIYWAQQVQQHTASFSTTPIGPD